MVNWTGLATLAVREVRRTMRVAVQTIFAPVVSATLYIFIFGFVIGTKIEEVAGVPYITFVFPGILMLNVINAAFSSSSSSLYFMRFTRGIEEILVAPFSHLEMIAGLVLGSLLRSFIVAALIMLVGVAFGAVTLLDPLAFFGYVFGVAVIFSLLGLLVALWAEGFEQLSILNTFLITPLTYLGGIFYSLTLLPPIAETITRLNPFFYFVDGIRRAMVGVTEAAPGVGFLVTSSLIIILGTLVYFLFKKGWRLRF